MRRLAFFYFFLSAAIIVGFLWLMTLVSGQASQSNEAAFNAQQIGQVRLSLQAIEDDFSHKLAEARVLASSLLSTTSQSTSVLASSDIRAEFAAYGFFPEPGAADLVWMLPTSGTAETRAILQDWVNVYWNQLESPGDFVVTPVSHLQDNQWYGLLVPVFEDDSFLGVLALLGDFKALVERYVRPLDEINREGALLLVNENGSLLYYSQRTSARDALLSLEQSAFVPTLLANLSSERFEGTSSGEQYGSDKLEGVNLLVAWGFSSFGHGRVVMVQGAPAAAIGAGLGAFGTQFVLLGGLLFTAIGLTGIILIVAWQRVTSRQFEATARVLRQTEDRYQLLFDYSPDAILLIDPFDPEIPWRIVDCNSAACQMNGYTREELLSHSVSILHPIEYSPSGRQGFLERLRADSPIHYRTRHQHKDGHLFPIEVANALVSVDGRELVLGIDHDISDWVRADQTLRQHNQAMLGLNKAAIAISSALDREEVLQKLIQAAEDLFPNAVGVTIQLLDENSKEAGTVLASDGLPHFTRNLKFQSGKGLVAYAIAERQVMNVPDVQADDRYVRGESPPNYASLLVAPLISGEHVWGTVSITRQAVGAFDAHDEIIVNLLARQAGVAIDNANRYHIEQQQREISETLREIGIVFTGALHREEVLAQSLDQVRRLIDYDAASVWTRDADGSFHRFVAVGYDRFGIPPEAFNMTWPGDASSALKMTADQGTIQIISDTGASPNWLSYTEEYDWLRSWVGVPITVQGQILGVLCLDHAQPGFYRESHRPILEALSLQISLSVENALLFEQVQAYAADLESQVSERTDEILHEKERTEAILRNIEDGVVIVDLSGLITYTNDAVTRLLGWSAAEVLGRPLEHLFPPIMREQVNSLLRAAPQRQAWRNEMVLARRDGVPVSVEVAGVPYRGPSGAIEGLITSMRPLASAQVLERMKWQFMDLVSHELRTPMTNMKLYVHLLRRTLEDPVRSRGHLAALEGQTDRLVQLMEKVLSVTRLTDVEAMTSTNQVFLDSIAQNLRVRLDGQAQQQGIDLVVDGLDANHVVFGDEQWLTQACFELVDNALTYTPQGGSIHLKLVDFCENGQNYTGFQVSDTGPGISPEELDELNTPFIRVGAQRSGSTSGMGLGLFIARTVAERHGGGLRVESEPDHGSTFTLYLPVKA